MKLQKKMRFISILAVLIVGLASFTSIGLIMQHNNRLLYDKVADSMSQSAADIEASLNHIKTLSGLIITDAPVSYPNLCIQIRVKYMHSPSSLLLGKYFFNRHLVVFICALNGSFPSR